MKLAIIGSGPVALYAANHFYNIGAHVVLFQRSPLGGVVRFMRKYQIQGKVDYPKEKSVEDFWNEDLVSLIEFVEENNLTKAGEVLRIHKRFLHQNEEVLERSRMSDLFRVIYATNPKDSILKQVEENKEIFQKLGEDILNSLRTPVESFEDFDVVIEATGLGKTDFKMGPSGAFALNENNLNHHSHFYYGKDFFKNFNQEDSSIKTVALVGDDLSTELAFGKLQDWPFSNPNHQLIWIRRTPITDIHLKDELNFIFDRADKKFDADRLQYETELRKWRDLEDFVRAKVPPPLEPKKRIEVYTGYNVTSVDKLLDREGIFLTIESPDFRKNVSHSTNLKTICVDAVIVQNGVDQNERLGVNMQEEEPGHYVIHTTSLKEALKQIVEIENDLMNYFSKSDQ